MNVLYALLALSVIVSLFGIVNTLVLTVFERTRELGMLRAIGMTRRQVRRMIRYESIVTALIEAALGIAVGVFLAARGRPGELVNGNKLARFARTGETGDSQGAAASRAGACHPILETNLTRCAGSE
jgi:hypothetical protein